MNMENKLYHYVKLIFYFALISLCILSCQSNTKQSHINITPGDIGGVNKDYLLSPDSGQSTKFYISQKYFDIILLPNSLADVSINIKNIGKYNARNIKAELPVTNGKGIEYHLQGDGFIGDILSGKSKNITL